MVKALLILYLLILSLSLGTSGSPFHSRATSYTTPGSANISLSSQHLSKSHSPMATISRCQSPNHPVFSTMSGASLGHFARCSKSYQPQLNFSISPSERNKSCYNKAQNIISDNLLSEGAIPELCFEHIWSENFGLAKESNVEEASKVFLTADLVGQSYFCYLVKNKCRLHLVRLEKCNKQEQIILGMVTIVNAEDVVNLSKLKMMAVIESNGNISIYSGISIVGKLHIPGIFPNIVRNSYTLSNFYGTKFLSPYPRRSSLISPSKLSTPEVKFDDGLHLLSPVTGMSTNLNLMDNSLGESISIHLKNTVSNKLVFEYGDSVYFEITLPMMRASPLVDMCLRTLENVLPHDAAMLILIEWYIARNAPGPQDLTMNQEWNLFLTIFFTLFGYDVSKLGIIMTSEIDYTSGHNSPIMVSKKQRTINMGSVDDWSYIMKSGITNEVELFLSDTIGFNKLRQRNNKCAVNIRNTKIFDANKTTIQSVYTSSLPHVLFSLHLLYEEIKLNYILSESLFLLGKFLFQLSIDLNLSAYKQHYISDFPALNTCKTNFQINDLDVQKVITSNFVLSDPPDIFQVLYDLLTHSNISSYPYLVHVNPLSKNLLLLFMKMSKQNQVNILEIDPFFKTVSSSSSEDKIFGKKGDKEVIEDIIMYCHEIGMNRQEIDKLPLGINFVFSTLIYQCREEPSMNFPSLVYELIDRQDLAALEGKISNSYHLDYIECRNNVEHNDGMEIDFSIFRLRFNTDQRVREARKLLDSSEPVKISIIQKPDVSDHEFIEEQEKFLYALCTRTMALPIGRGMFTLRTCMPVNTEQLTIPRLCLTGKAPPRGTSIELTHIDVPSNMNLWPLFHNGVATGLCIHPRASNVDSTWIVYNKQQQGEFGIEHSGFLMALGLNGHLKNLAPFSMYEYLVECHEATSVGLLLGLSATHRCSMNVSMTKLLSLHVETLLPPTSIELNVQQNVQVAALMGVGLVYQETNHRHIAHALLSEIGRPPGPEMKNCVDRESYSLAAGLALGLVVLCSGGKSDLGNIPEKLHYYMVGGYNRPFCGAQKDKYKSPSYQIREGNAINIDVTSPGATIALGLMYLKTGNRAVAEWMTVPNTQYLLDFARPDFLLLRTLAKSLILWDEIDPSKTWISCHVPDIVSKYKLRKPSVNISEPIDLETINQAYCNIIAGACMAVGLKYAGTENVIAFRALYHFLKMFMALAHKSVAQLAGKATIETCLNVVLLSASMVMSGTGNLEILRVCRYMRTRVGSSNNVVTYGSHVAIHMSLGFLFLGGGSLTLSNSTSSIAALLISIFPKFPTHSNDNRYHLQALRHFYVLSTEPRLLLPKDIDNGKFCYAKIQLTFHSNSQKEGQKLILQAPCLIPQLNRLRKVELNDDRYWKIIFETNRNFDQLTKILLGNSVLNVKQRAGCLSHMEDPQGFRSLLAHVLTTEDVIVWTASLRQITSFTTSATILKFIDRFLRRGHFRNEIRCDNYCANKMHDEHTSICFGYLKNITGQKKSSLVNQIYEIPQEISINENHCLQILIRMTYECVVRDKVNFLPLWVTIYKILSVIKSQPKINLIWQMKFIHIFKNSESSVKLLNLENVLANKQNIYQIMDKWEDYLSQTLNSIWKMEYSTCFEAYDKLFSYMLNYDIALKINQLAKLPDNPIESETIQCLNAYGAYRFHGLFKNHEANK